MTTRPHVIVYTGAGCCLCDRAIAIVERVAQDVRLSWEVRDIATELTLEEALREKVPAIALDGRLVMSGKVSEFWLRRALRGETLERLTAL